MMEKLAEKWHGLSGFFLRLGLGFVYLFSGYSKLFLGNETIGICSNRVEAVSLVSGFTWIPLDPGTFVIVQSVLELILGLVLIIGLKIRWAALISAVLMILFLLLIDFQLIWKDVCLLGMSLALVLTKENRWSLDSRFHSKPII